jgi:hypothetical protein
MDRNIPLLHECEGVVDGYSAYHGVGSKKQTNCVNRNYELIRHKIQKIIKEETMTKTRHEKHEKTGI